MLNILTNRIILPLSIGLCVFASARPAGIFPLDRAPFLTELVEATVFNPQWSRRKPLGETLERPLSANRLDDYSAVIVLLKDGWRVKWQGKDLRAAEEYLKQGGILIFMDNAVSPRTMDPVVLDLQRHGRALWISKSFLTSKTAYRQKSSRLNADWHDVEANMRPIHGLLLQAGTDCVADDRELWTPRPLGPAAAAGKTGPPKIRRSLEGLFECGRLPGAEVVVTERTLIVVPRFSVPGVNGWRLEAAGILQELVRRCSGVRLDRAYEHQTEIVRSGSLVQAVWRGQKYDSVISIGNTEFGKRRCGAPAMKTPDSAGVFIADSAVCLYGEDPRNAVYAFAQDILGYRWLWPGELGEIVPEFHGGIVLRPQYCCYQVPFIRRDMRDYLMNGVLGSNAGLLGQTPEHYASERKESVLWFKRMKLRGSYRHHGGDNFLDWYGKYGASHPEIFALQPDKSRVQQTPGRPRLCVTNPRTLSLFMEETRRRLAGHGDIEYLTIGPADGSYNSFCMCENCRKCDPRGVPDAEKEVYQVFFGLNRPQYLYPSLADRYLRFYIRIAGEMQRHFPRMKVLGLVYSCYRNAPALPVELPENLKILFVGTQYFNEKALQKDRRDWDRWAALSDEIILRPNALYEGHGMPSCFIGELDKDIKHFYQTGMIGADYDAVVHHWSTQGLNYYVLAQLLWNPGLDVNRLVDDYCRQAFGPAAAVMRGYFRALEALTSRMASENSGSVDEIEDLTRVRYDFLRDIPWFYDDGCLLRLAAVLERARKMTREGSAERKRVGFFEAGLQYGRLTSRFLRRYHEGERRELEPFLRRRLEKLMRMKEEFPFALHMPVIARAEWTLWRDCGFEPWRKAKD